MTSPEIESARTELITWAQSEDGWQGTPYLGKFDSELGEAAWMAALDSSSDESCGDLDWGHYDLFESEAMILECASSGAVYAIVHESAADARTAYETIARAWNSVDSEFDSDRQDDSEPESVMAWARLAGQLGALIVCVPRCDNCHDVDQDESERRAFTIPSGLNGLRCTVCLNTIEESPS